MNYNELRSKARDGDIIFLTVDSNNFLSRMTSRFTKSQFTHAAFVFWMKERLMVIESTTHGGIRIVLASTYSDRNFELVSSNRVWSDIEGKVLSKSGTTRYGWFSAFYIGLREFCKNNFNIRLPMFRDNKNKACSEFVSEMLEYSDVDISPGKLYNLLNIK